MENNTKENIFSHPSVHKTESNLDSLKEFCVKKSHSSNESLIINANEKLSNQLIDSTNSGIVNHHVAAAPLPPPPSPPPPPFHLSTTTTATTICTTSISTKSKLSSASLHPTCQLNLPDLNLTTCSSPNDHVKRSSLLTYESNLLYIDEGESNADLNEENALTSSGITQIKETLSNKACNEEGKLTTEESTAKMNRQMLMQINSESKLNQQELMRGDSKSKVNQQEISREDLESNLNQHTLMREYSESKLNQLKIMADESNSKLNQRKLKREDSDSKLNRQCLVGDEEELKLNQPTLMKENTESKFNQQKLMKNYSEAKLKQHNASEDLESKVNYLICSPESSSTPVKQTKELANEIVLDILENVFSICHNKHPIVEECNLKDEPKNNGNIIIDNDSVKETVTVIITDTEPLPIKQSFVIGREESIDEYEQALDVVTPDPGHGFNHSTGSVATVIRVDTPNYPQTRPSLEEDEIEDIFVDASEDVNEIKYAEVYQQQIHTHSTSLPMEVLHVSTSECKVVSDIPVCTSATVSPGLSGTLSVDMETSCANNKITETINQCGSASKPVHPGSRYPLILKQKEGNVAEDGSASSGGHVTDPDMLASASASSTGSEMSWTSGGGPVARRDLLPLDEDEDEVQWRALLAVNPPDSDEEERTGYESDEDFDTMDAEMRRLEEKLRRFERELGENVTDEMKDSSLGKPSGGPLLLRSQDLEALRISPLPEVYPAVCTAKTKHLSLMSHLQVQEYEESCSGSGSDSDDPISSEDSADFLFVKTKIKLKPGERKCRSLDQKRPKNDNILNEGIGKNKVEKEQSCVCDETLDLSSLALPGETIDDESLCSGCNVLDQVDIPPPPDFENITLIEYESNLDTYRPENPQCLLSDDESMYKHDTMYCADNNMLLGYIWHEDDGMAAVDFEGLEDFYSYEGQGALMIMFEDDMDEDFVNENIETSENKERLLNQFPQDNQWKEGIEPVASSAVKGSNKSERTFVSAFKNSLKKASKYLGPKSENPYRKVGSPTECRLPEWPASDNNNVLASHEPSTLIYSHVPSPIDEESSAGVYNVQSGQVTPAVVFSFSDNERRDIHSCSSGEYYASPAVCVNTSDEDPVIPPAPPLVLPPAPPPRWVHWKPPVFKEVNSGQNDFCMQDVTWCSPPVSTTLPQSVQAYQESRSLAPQTVQAYQEISSQPIPPPVPPPVNCTQASLPTVNDDSEMQFYLVGVPNTDPIEKDVHQQVGLSAPEEHIEMDMEPSHTVLNSKLSDTNYMQSGKSVYDSHTPCNTVNLEKHSCESHCQCPNQRLTVCDMLLGDLPHLDNVPHAPPTHKPTSVKQLKRKQQEKILRQEAEEGVAALGCTFCMGVPLTRTRPPESSAHWRQPSPHPKAITDRRSWPPRK